MGQPVSAIQKSSLKPGVLRFEINRSLTGMGHERYEAETPVLDDRPPDRLARRLFEHHGVASVYIYGNMISVEAGLTDLDAAAVKSEIEDLYLFYRDGVAPAAVES